MNKKINKFLFAICILFLGIGIASAEIDYNTVCKGMKGDELLRCCDDVEDHKTQVECQNSAFKTCGNAKGLQKKLDCCSGFSNFLDQLSCNSYVKSVCTPSDSVEMNKAAMKVKISYEPVDVKDPNNSKITYYMLDIKIYNF